MNIKNGRLYQYSLEKLRVKPLALTAAHAVRLAARTGLMLSAAFRPGKTAPVREEETKAARARVQAAFAKPKLTDREARKTERQTDGDKKPVDLSVIVPVYNVGEFFEPCVQSVYDQRTKYRYELILIDDGSQEDTAKRAAKCAENENTLVLRQENKGAAAARNNGLDHARGEYVMFLDADDLLKPGAIESLMNAAKERNADWVQGGWEYVDGPKQAFESAVYEGDTRMALIELPGMPWGKVIRRDVFQTLRFPAGYTSYVDTPIKCLTLRMCKRAATIGDIVYAWRRNPQGITFTSKKTPRALQTYWIMEQMQEDSRSLGLPEDDLYRAIWIRQMLTVNYDRLKGLDESLQRDVFQLARAFLRPLIDASRTKGLPFMLRLAAKAFRTDDFGLWKKLGRWYSLGA